MSLPATPIAFLILPIFFVEFLSLAPHVADVSPTCRRHRQMSPNLGRHCVSLRHRRGHDIPNLCQLQPTSIGNFPTCRQMSCRLDTLADTTFSYVCDMTETCRRHVADTTQNVAVWAKKRHADIRHVELSMCVSSRACIGTNEKACMS